MNIVYSLTIFTIVSVSFVSADYVICEGDKNLWIDVGEIIFFETLNFPKNSTPCSFNISTATDVPIRMQISIINGETYPYYFKIHDNHTWVQVDSDYLTYNSNILLNISSLPGHTFVGVHYRGSISVEKNINSSCHLTDASQPFIFTDVGQIIDIYPWYIDALKPIKANFSCHWQFLGPPGYGFKIVFKRYSNVSYRSGETVIIRNSTNHVIADLYSEEFKPYYNNDKNITITYTSGHFPYGFEAYITIVEQNPDIVDANCQMTPQGVWHNIYGDQYPYFHTWYPNNAKCSTILELQSNHMFILQFDLRIEYGVDTMTYFLDDNFNDVTEVLPTKKTLAFQAPTTKSLKYNFTFTSDGSGIGEGFSISRTSFNCQCGKKEYIFPCTDYYDQQIHIMDPADNWNFCANLKCSYQLYLACPDWIAEMHITPTNFDCTQTNYTFLSDDQVILTQCGAVANTAENFGIVSPHQTGYLEFSSGPIPSYSELAIWVTAVKPPAVMSTLILTKTTPMFFIDLAIDIPARSQMTIKLGSEIIDDKIEIIGNEAVLSDLFLIYQNENLTGFLGSIQNFHGEVNKSITIYAGTKAYGDIRVPGKVIVRAKKTQSQNCIYENTIFYGTDKSKVSMVASDEGSCHMTLILSGVLVLDGLWTNSETENVIIYTNVNKTHKLVEFNKNTAEKLRFLIVSTYVLLIEIPKNSSVYLEVKKIEEYGSSFVSPGFEISKPVKSLIYLNTNDLTIIYQIRNISTSFTVTEWTYSSLFNPPPLLSFIPNGEPIALNFTGIGQTYKWYSADLLITSTNNWCDSEKVCDYGHVMLTIEAE